MSGVNGVHAAMSQHAFHCASAWVDGAVVDRARVLVDGDGAITDVIAGVPPEPGDVRLSGMVLPGFANAHSHAFHRALRGRTHGDGGTFWTWREQMYRLAAVLDPDSYRRLATAVYGEMALAGITAVGEFHYLHHDPAGRRYADPNAMGWALADAAAAAGIRLTLLDTCYLRGAIGAALEGTQRRFGDGDADAWAQRVSDLADSVRDRASGADVIVGAAAHSVRAVPPDQLAIVAGAAHSANALHVHVSEQPAENEQCLAAYGRTPTQVLHEAGALRPTTTAVHATHLTESDVAALGGSTTTVCLCPTTERDLADGIGPAPSLHTAGSPLALGSDQHAVVDMFEEQRAVELNERLASGRRGTFPPAELTAMATVNGHRSLGRRDVGRIAVGQRADMVAVRTDSVRTAGAHREQLAFAATAADVATVVVGGRVIVDEGVHVLGEVGTLLATAIGELEEKT